MDSFVNLHLHSDASLGDSIIKVPDLVKKLEEYEQEYVALTDHSSCMNHYALRKACEGTNIKPIYGNEFYCRLDTTKPSDRTRYHLVLLAMNQDGLTNINKMQRIAVQDYFYYKPLLPHDVLFDNTEGIFVSTACALSYIAQCFLSNEDDKAYNDLLQKYRQLQNEYQLINEAKLHLEYEIRQKNETTNKILNDFGSFKL